MNEPTFLFNQLNNAEAKPVSLNDIIELQKVINKYYDSNKGDEYRPFRSDTPNLFNYGQYSATHDGKIVRHTKLVPKKNVADDEKRNFINMLRIGQENPSINWMQMIALQKYKNYQDVFKNFTANDPSNITIAPAPIAPIAPAPVAPTAPITTSDASTQTTSNASTQTTYNASTQTSPDPNDPSTPTKKPSSGPKSPGLSPIV